MAKVKTDNDILINVLLDRSGSMANLINDVIGHFNQYIEDQANQPGEAKVSLIVFDTIYEEIYLNIPIKEVPVLTHEKYYARGGTAYLDALGKLIKSVDAVPDKPKKVVFVINTDGEENSSREYSLSTIKDLITERTNNHDWQFVFIGAGLENTADLAKSIGIYNFTNASHTAAGSWSTYSGLTDTTTMYRSGLALNMNIAANMPNEEDAPEDIKKKAKKKKTTSITP